MKEIKIFIGSSVDKQEFELEREKLGSFINGLNRQYVKQGIFIDLYDCEIVSNKMRAEGSQKQHDDYIENEADATFFMFFKKAGEFTLHELQVARDALVNKNRPDIFTYFKVVGDDIEQTDEIKKAVDVIANSYGHYFSKFTDVDTIKLGMLQYLVDKLNDGSSITINEGRIYLNNTEVNGISIDNIFAYQNNVEYKNLQRDIENLTEAINTAIENKQFADIEAFTVQKEEKEKLLANLEKDILNILIQMQKELKKANADPLRMQAYQLIEMGKIKEAQQLFPISTLKAKAENLLLKNEMQQQDNKELVENAKVRIETLELDISNADRFELMEDTYDSVLENAFLCFVNDFIFAYCCFLDEQNNSPKAFEIAKRLEGLYLLNESKFEKSDFADLYNGLGIICGNLSFTKEQEHYYTEAIEIYEQLAKDNPERYNSYLAQNYNIVGCFYHNQNNSQKAECYFTKAIEIFEQFAKYNPERYNADLAMSYNNAGIFYYLQSNIERTEYYFIKVIEIFEQFAKYNPERYNADLATGYNNIGVFYKEQGNAEKADLYYNRTIELYEQLAEDNPERYNADLAMSYNNAGALYDEQSNVEKAEYYYTKAIELYEQLAKYNPERYNADLATSYNNAGAFYDDQGNTEKAAYYHIKAIEIREQLAKENPERYSANLTRSYNNAGAFYDDQGNTEKAAYYHIKAIEIGEQLAKENPERYSANLARSYNNAGSFYNGQGDIQKAEWYCTKAIEIGEQLVKDNPERYNKDLAVSYYTYGECTDEDKYFDKALMLAKTQPEDPCCRQIILALEN